MALSLFTHVTCLTCGHIMPPDPMLAACELCKGDWLDAGYDYAAVHWPETLRKRAPNMWRYAELLPVTDYNQRVSIGEGFTPLVRAEGLQQAFGHPTLWIKDERQSPTGSFKDRQGSLSVSILKSRGVRECVLASTGNAAAAYAASSPVSPWLTKPTCTVCPVISGMRWYRSPTGSRSCSYQLLSPV